MVTHSSILALEIPWTEEPGGLWFRGSKRVGRDWETEQLVWSKVKVDQLCVTLCDSRGIRQARILERVAFPFSRGSSQPRDWTQVSCIAGGFFTSWATREAQEYWSGYPTLLQGIFPTQELNQGLLHCRRILYQLSFEGSPNLCGWAFHLWGLMLVQCK